VVYTLVKELLGVSFEYDESSRELTIRNKVSGNTVVISRLYMFSLMRFIVSISQKPIKKRKKV